MTTTKEKIKVLDEELKGKVKDLIDLKIKTNKNSRDRNLKNKLKDEYKSFMESILNKISSEDILISNLDIEEFIEPEGICEGVATGITFKRTQLRKFFAEVKLISEKNKGEQINSIDITKLIPKLAYSQARGLIDNHFFQFMKSLLEKVRRTKSKEDYENFVDIFEAIVAYHYYYNPKED